jgi:hypothetical protein
MHSVTTGEGKLFKLTQECFLWRGNKGYEKCIRSQNFG